MGNHGAQDCLLVRLSRTGSVLWEKCLGGEGNDQLLRDGRTAGQAAPRGNLCISDTYGLCRWDAAADQGDFGPGEVGRTLHITVDLSRFAGTTPPD